MKQTVFTAIRVVVSGFLIFLLVAPAAKIVSPAFPLVDVGGLPEILRTAGKGFLLVAALCFLVSVLIAAWRWKTILSDDKIPFFLLLRLTLIGLFFNNFLPTGAGGDIVKGYYLLKGRTKKLDLGISIFMDRLVGTLSIMTLGFIAFLFSSNLPKLAVYFIPVIYVVLLFFLLFFAWPGMGRIFGRALFLSTWGKPGESVRRFYYGLHNYLQNPSSLFRAILISFAGQLLIVGANYLVTLSLKTAVPPILLFTSIPLIWAFAAVPSLGGLGVREAGYLFFFQGQMGRENAFALALLILGLSLLASLAGGLTYFLGGVQWQKKN